MYKSEQHTATMSKIGENLNVTQDVTATIEKFVCALYGKLHMNSVDDVRFAFFQQYYAPKKLNYPLEKIKGVNSNSMPLCSSTVLNKIRRANYVAYIWKNADLPRPCTTSTAGHGWDIINGQCTIKWFDCDQVPGDVCKIIGLQDSYRYFGTDDESVPQTVICDSDESEDSDNGD